MVICRILIFIILLILAIWDIRRTEVPVILVAIGVLISFAGMIADIIEYNINMTMIISAIMPGIIMILASISFPHRIGSADGFALIVAIAGTGIGHAYMTILFVSVISFIAAGAVMFISKGRRKVIPYIPVIAAGSIASQIFIILERIKYV